MFRKFIPKRLVCVVCLLSSNREKGHIEKKINQKCKSYFFNVTLYCMWKSGYSLNPCVTVFAGAKAIFRKQNESRETIFRVEEKQNEKAK